MSNQWDDWDDWEDWQDWGEPNRYGFYGLNCKNRPSGTGTTHSNRREARRNLQWDNLTKAVPDTEETLASQAAALEKAAEKAKKKLEEMKKKREEEEEEEEAEEASSSTNVNYRGKKKKQRPKSTKKAALEKAAGSALEKAKGDEPALEKAEAEGTIRRGRRAKHGQKELLMEKEEEEELPLEKGKKTKQEQDVSLEKGTKTEKKSLEKDPQGVVLKPAAKNPPKAKLVPAEKPLEKGKEEKAICVVDWHHTLEVRDMVPESHIKALRGLVKATKEVHIVSYVESEKRERQVKKDARDFLPKDLFEQLKVHCTWKRTGPGGKKEVCKYLGASVIFDDSPEVAQECLQGGLMVFAICTKWCRHGDMPQSMVFSDFAEAVEAYLEI